MISWLQGVGISLFFRIVFLLRYRVEIRGMETLRSLKKNKGILFLANHTAYSEAILLFSYLFPKFNVRSVPNEYMFRNPLLAPMIKASRAVRMPRRSSNKLILKKAAEALDQIADGLRQGDRFIYYPGGQTKSTAKEWIGGSTGAYTLLQKVPDVQVVLVRTTGLWGSSFSRAFTQGNSPNLGKSLITTLKMLLKNLVFLSPRRNVVIELEPNPLDLPRMGTRMALNQYLENWYNHYPQGANRVKEEPLQLVSRSLWSRDLPQLPAAKKEEPFKEVSLQTKTILYDQIRIILQSPDLVIEPSSHLSKDLGMDSLHLADLTSFVSKRFEIRGLLRDDFQTVQDLLEIAEKVRGVSSLKTGSYHWPDEPHRPEPLIPKGNTFHEIFLRVVDRMGPFAAIGDDLVGVLTYKKLKKSVFIVAQALQEIPEERVAILLPASAPALILFLACHFAGKIPVMLNWTLGERFLEEIIRSAKVKTIVSSWSFVDRLSHLNLENLSDHFLFLEDIRANLSMKQKLKGLLFSSLPTWMILQKIKAKPEDPYVILFTSGSESVPKGVPLSHDNLIEYARSGIERISRLRPDDSGFAFLPFFHTFGLISLAIVSVMTGAKTTLYPDPTDGGVLAEQIERWKVTRLFAPPNFLRRIIQASKKGQLKSVRNFVSASDKSSPGLIELAKSLFYEGEWLDCYGITECTGAVTYPLSGQPCIGVGRPLSGIEICTIHPETLEPLPYGAEGEICIFGKTVFKGYLSNEKHPFLLLDGKKWYRSGDLGYLDQEGNLHISGRLKRFTKISGEMISLTVLEEVLTQQLVGSIGSEPTVAIIVDELQKDHSQLVVFSTVPLDRETANQIIKKNGFSNLVKISAVRNIEKIPLHGTGKINYLDLQMLTVQGAF